MSLTGVWMNELRSILLLDEDEDGALAGKFRSIVGRDPHVRILTGRKIRFAVSWVTDSGQHLG